MHENIPVERQDDVPEARMSVGGLPFAGERQLEPVEIPRYDPATQFGLDDLEREFPQWREETSYDDPVLAAVAFVRTQTLRDVGRRNGMDHSMVHLGGEGLKWAVDNTPVEVGRQFDSHGIANKRDPVKDLDQLMTNGIDPERSFYSMSFEYAPQAGALLGADRPFTGGGFIAVSPAGHKLVEAGPAMVVLGEEYVRTQDLLQQKYPGVRFVSWDQAPVVLTEQSNKAGLTQATFETPIEPVTYPMPVAAEAPFPPPVEYVPPPVVLREPKDDDTEDVW